MAAYDDCVVTLDAGRTLLALRALDHPGGHYPFIDRFRRRRRGHSQGPFSRWFPTVSWLLARPRPFGGA